MTSKIRVLIVDDSALVRQILQAGLSADPALEIVGCARDPYIARDILVKERPDVIILDIEMPRMDGISFLKRYMQVIPTPTIVFSSITGKGKQMTINALEAGALAVMEKPQSGVSDHLPCMVADLSSKIKEIANVGLYASRIDLRPPSLGVTTPDSVTFPNSQRIIAIGASTGGVEALARILPMFPAATPGMVIVEHMPAGFTHSFAQRLDQLSLMTVKEAEKGDRIRPGLVLLAPGGDAHMVVKRSGIEYCIDFQESEKVSGHIPSVDVLFESVAKAAGEKAISILMTGMGTDGAQGMLKIRLQGGRTAAQNKSSSVVYGMPGEAMRIQAAEQDLPLMDIPTWVLNLLK